MISTLSSSQYSAVRPLCQALDVHLTVEAVISGASSGQVYADDPIHPQVALVQTGHRLYLAGHPDNRAIQEDLRRFFLDVYYPQGLASHKEAFILYFEPAGWEPIIAGMLQAKRPILAYRQAYEFCLFKQDWRSMLPDGFSLRLVDRSLLAEEHLRYLPELKEELCSERASVEEFLQKSFGVCLVKGDELAGWCLSEYNCGDRCEIGIETRPDYRQRGLATLMTTAFVEMARLRGYNRIGWHCWTRNVPSAATAVKAGFEKVKDCLVYFAYFNPETQNA